MAKKKYKPAPKDESQEHYPVDIKANDVVVHHAVLSKWLPFLLLFLFGTLLYINTVKNDYAVDDTLVVTQNKFTQQGFAGLKEIFTTDAFEGFFGERGKSLVAGGRYRPLSIASFAVEIGLFGKNKPAISHFNNAVLYGLTIAIIFSVLLLLFPMKDTNRWWFSTPFLIALLYAAHPIHTEAVANIKGRDEILGMLFMMGGLYASIQYFRSDEKKWLGILFISYCLALLSKENSITLVAIALLSGYVFCRPTKQQYYTIIGVYSLPTLLFLYIRSAFTSSALSKFTTEIMNDPFTFSSFSQKFGTLFYTYLLYFKLMLFPHPLTHDYYPYQIPKIELFNLIALLSVVLNIGLFVYAVYSIRKRKDHIGYGLLFYFITFSIVSQVLFTIGTPMSERFVFIPSLGFMMAIVLLVQQLSQKNEKLFFYGVYVVAILFSLKTVSRNPDWKNDYTLFTHDVQISTQSAKLNMAVGGALLDSAENVLDTIVRNQMIVEAIEHLNTSIEIYGDTTIEVDAKQVPIGYANAYNLLGNAYFMLNKDLDNAEKAYKMASYYQPGHFDAYQNLVVIYNEAKKWNESIPILKALISFKPDNAGFLYKLGDAYQHIFQPDSAILFYKQSIALDPTITAAADFQIGICLAQLKGDLPTALTYFNKAELLDTTLKSQVLYQIGLTYSKFKNDLATGIVYLSKAVALDPSNIHYNEDLGVSLAFSHRPAEAIIYFKKCLVIQPSYQNVLGNIASAYAELGKTDSSNIYRSRQIK